MPPTDDPPDRRRSDLLRTWIAPILTALIAALLFLLLTRGAPDISLRNPTASLDLGADSLQVTLTGELVNLSETDALITGIRLARAAAPDLPPLVIRPVAQVPFPSDSAYAFLESLSVPGATGGVFPLSGKKGETISLTYRLPLPGWLRPRVAEYARIGVVPVLSGGPNARARPDGEMGALVDIPAAARRANSNIRRYATDTFGLTTMQVFEAASGTPPGTPSGDRRGTLISRSLAGAPCPAADSFFPTLCPVLQIQIDGSDWIDLPFGVIGRVSTDALFDSIPNTD